MTTPTSAQQPSASQDRWRTGLEASVYGLRLATKEYRAALRFTEGGLFAVDPHRVRPHPGAVRTHGAGLGISQPHSRALWMINDMYGRLRADLETEYERAALLYVYGAAWAARQVLDGHAPDVVDLALHHSQLIPAQARPAIADDLTKCTIHAAFTTSLKELEACENAADHAQSLAEQDYLADHEASEMHDALDMARGMAEAAYKHGLQAEKALMYALNVRAQMDRP